MNKLKELINELCPNGVKYKNIQELCKISRGKVMSKDFIKSNAGEYPVYSSQTENNGELGKISTYDFDGEYLTWTTDGANAGSVFYRKGKFSVTNVCGLLEIKNKVMIPKFLYYVLSIEAPKYVNAGMGNPKLMSNVMTKIRVAVPPLEVQCEIVHILDDFTLLSAELSAELKARQSQYNFYKDKIFNISEKTNYVEIKDILQEKGYIRGPFGSALRKSDMVKNGVPIYEQQHAIYNHRNFRYFISNEKANNLSRFMVKEGDIILSCSGTVGRTSIIKSADEKGVINQALLILRIDSNKINVRFLEHFLNSSYGKKKILSNTNGSAQVNICKREEFEKIKIPLPQIDEQNKIVNILDRFDKLCNDISEGLPAEIEARQKQYEYYRDKLLTYKELKVNE